MTDGGRRLLVVRHGKAEAYGEDDHSRELNARGARDADALGSWLHAQGLLPDHAIVSSAQRTQQTWQALAAGAGLGLEPQVEDGVYNADPDSVFDVLRHTDDAHRTVLLLGHNPTVAWIANSLDDGEGDPTELMRIMDGFPPASCAVLEVDGDWASLGDGKGRVIASWRP